MSLRVDERAEWLEADGLGGYASGTVNQIRTRRYHALLLAATAPPVSRFVLVNGMEAWLDTKGGPVALTSQRYAPGVVHPDGARRIDAFESAPWPKWEYLLEDGTRVLHEIFVPPGAPVVVLSWKLAAKTKGVTLNLRPLLSGRDPHQLHHENSGFRFDAEASDGRVLWRPYPGVPAIGALSNGEYLHAPDWYRNFLYEEERARGLDFTEDLATPGTFRFDLSKGEAILILAAGEPGAPELAAILPAGATAGAVAKKLRSAEEKRRARAPSRLHRAAEAYLVKRGGGRTIIAGYPWFCDWGRDTFIALRGLCLATGNLDAARDILVEWASAVSEGMLPNAFPDGGEAPRFNSVDASLWYVVAVNDTMHAMEAAGRKLPAADAKLLRGAVEAILEGYARGTRYGIRMDADGLLACGRTGVQLTWMDAKVGDWVVTPRTGKPVEVQALWLNALLIGSAWNGKWQAAYARGLDSFRSRFWNEAGGFLHDVVDVDHVPGTADATFRPNQIFAVGGLPVTLLEPDQARRVVDAVEGRLLTPLGLRSLAPGEPGYAPRYEGGVVERDGAYHQGTVWPWLMGPFVEAWIRVRGGTAAVKKQARSRFLAPILVHLDDAGLGHVSELTDAEPPYTPRGCPFQAWSVGEAIRLDTVVLAEEADTRPVKVRKAPVRRARARE